MTTVNTVEQAIQELQRFNPLARIATPVDIGGVSPSTECSITVDRTEIDSLQEIIDALEIDLKKADDKIDEVRGVIKDVDGGTPVTSLISAIEDIIA